jgi:hypothetical protein
MAEILRLSIGVRNWVSLLKNLSGLGIGLAMMIAMSTYDKACLGDRRRSG